MTRCPPAAKCPPETQKLAESLLVHIQADNYPLANIPDPGQFKSHMENALKDLKSGKSKPLPDKFTGWMKHCKSILEGYTKRDTKILGAIPDNKESRAKREALEKAIIAHNAASEFCDYLTLRMRMINESLGREQSRAAAAR